MKKEEKEGREQGGPGGRKRRTRNSMMEAVWVYWFKQQLVQLVSQEEAAPAKLLNTLAKALAFSVSVPFIAHPSGDLLWSNSSFSCQSKLDLLFEIGSAVIVRVAVIPLT